MTLKAPFQLPAGFLPAFGYRGGRRFVGLYWEPSGDEAAYDANLLFSRTGEARRPRRDIQCGTWRQSIT
jgi:hypothetical protein